MIDQKPPSVSSSDLILKSILYISIFGSILFIIVSIVSFFVLSIIGINEDVATYISLLLGLAAPIFFIIYIINDAKKSDNMVKSKFQNDLIQYHNTDKAIREYAGCHNIKLKHIYITPNGSGVISIDESKGIVIIGGYDQISMTTRFNMLDIETILEFKLVDSNDAQFNNGKSINDTLKSAAIGGLLFGGAGAVVGAIASQNPRHDTTFINEISICLTIDDLSFPFIKFNFISKPVVLNSPEYNDIKSEANLWVGRLQILKNRRNRDLSNRDSNRN